MDKQFTLKLQEWLATPKEQRNLEEGAVLLLQLSNNRILYNNVSRNLAKHADFIDFKLRRYLDFRLQDLTHAEVTEMQDKVQRIATEHALDKPSTAQQDTVAPDSPSTDATATNAGAASDGQSFRAGRRADHDTLPAEIQALYVENAHIMHQMRELHLKLRTMSTEQSTCPDSDRYPFLKEIIELDKRYHKNWQIYDHYVADAARSAEGRLLCKNSTGSSETVAENLTDSGSASSAGETADKATPAASTAVSAEVQLTEDFRQQQKNIYRQINLAKGRYKKAPSEKLKEQIASLYSQLASPVETLTAELKELGIIN